MAAAIVWLLRRPLFLYTVELGVTLTVLLLLAQCQVVGNTTWISWALLLAGLVSMMAQAIFSVDDAKEFSRKRYGMPLFATGHVQLAAGLVAIGIGHLLASHVFSYIRRPFGMTAEDSVAWYASAWVLGAVAYVSSPS